MRWTVFLCIFLVQIILTVQKFQRTCADNSIGTWALYFGHHLLDVFVFWAPLFLTGRIDFIAHLLAVIIVTVHWHTNSNQCILTVVMNRRCGYPEGDWLDSLKNMLGLRKFTENIHTIWVLALAAYDIYVIGSAQFPLILRRSVWATAGCASRALISWISARRSSNSSCRTSFSCCSPLILFSSFEMASLFGS